MKSNKNFIKYIAVIVLFLIAAVVSVLFVSKVSINYNLSDYLADDTETKIAIDIVEEDFGMTGNVQVMLTGVDVKTAKEVKNQLKQIEHVLNVTFDEYDSGSYVDGKALYVVLIDGDDNSQEAKDVIANIKTLLNDKFQNVQYAGSAIEKLSLREAILSEMGLIMIVAVSLVLALLLVTSKSWLEPIVILLASGFAVVINMGTNAILGQISYITNSISAILQLALSIDYSIVFIHAYQDCKKREQDNHFAMKAAIKQVIKPVTASALTTIAGLVALLFMSFKIGFDLGTVLIKGIFISAITALTLLPVLVLIFDKLLNKTKKKAFIPKGEFFCKTSFKASKAIVPIALAVIVACGVLQSFTSFNFTDTRVESEDIINTFGKNNSIVLVYEKGENDYEREEQFIELIKDYKKPDGTLALTKYTAYTNTVREVYDVEKAVKTLNINQADVEMLFTMYNLYQNNGLVTLTNEQFINFTQNLIATDTEIQDMVDSNLPSTLNMLSEVSYIASNEFTAEELYAKLSSGTIQNVSISQFAITQMYGLYFYDQIANPSVNFKTMLNYMVELSGDEQFAGMFTQEAISGLQSLKTVIDLFEAIYNALPQPTEQNVEMYNLINSNCKYFEFMPTLNKIAEIFTGSKPNVGASDEVIQQAYIMYFNSINALPQNKLLGKTFINFVKQTANTNAIVKSQLSDDVLQKLDDLLTVDAFMKESAVRDFKEMNARIGSLIEGLKSVDVQANLSEDLVSGVYIKYAMNNGYNLTSPMMAFELVDFISQNMQTNTLLKSKISEEYQGKIYEAQAELARGEKLFIGNEYSRILLSVNMPTESEETTAYISYLIDSVDQVFGENAYITGEVVSTYDLEKAFDADNLIISVFTIVSIFIIIMLIFKSISLPTILVAVIQGAIWMDMATSLIGGGGVFFMSYIVTTCILMGSTIDYGILMSDNYVNFRRTLNKKEALIKAVDLAMPTVFTSGLILTVCGFIISFISSQNAISSVGFLIGKGTLISIILIAFVLPAILYLFDKFVLKLTLTKKDEPKNDEK